LSGMYGEAGGASEKGYLFLKLRPGRPGELQKKVIFF
jgi:hypothetical protein